MSNAWLENRMVHTCTIERDTGTALSSTGEPQSVGSAVASDQACRFGEKTEGFAAEGRGFVTRNVNLLMLPDNADIELKDSIYLLQDSDSNVVMAGTYEVNRVLRRRDIAGNVYYISAELEQVETT